VLRSTVALLLAASLRSPADCVADLAEARRLTALQDFERALQAARRCPSPAGLVLEGNLLYLLARDSEAAALLERVLEKDPQNAEAQYALGRIHYFNARYERARELFAAIVAKDRNHYRAWDNLGLALEGVGKPEEAIQAHLKAIALVAKDHPEYDWAHGNLAELLMKQNQHSRQAFDLAVTAAERGPANARNFYLAAKALTRLDQWEKSIRWSRRAIELDRDYAEAHYLLAMALRRTGREEEARASFERTRVLREKAPSKKR
jgi:tetratricopeptide (TPR) repeat protein